jgi:hypothetical protein
MELHFLIERASVSAEESEQTSYAHVALLSLLQYQRNGGRQSLPFAQLFFQLLAAGPGQCVKPRAAVVV